ncbi:MAG: hypothetical protein J7474_09585, partial [Arthrobacter sp.]|nr:hypothetical protein [Arthrobacter sp.]
MDDTFIVLMFLVALLRLLRRLNAPALICLVWMLSCGVALWRTIDEGILTSDSAFFLFRQVCMPVLVVVSGLAMTRREWSWIIKVG